jgi:hypothetical protein
MQDDASTGKEVGPVPGSTRKDCESACGHGEMVMGQKCMPILHLEGEEMPKQPVSARPCLDVDMSTSWMPGPRVGAKSAEINELMGQQSSGKGGIPEPSIFF